MRTVSSPTISVPPTDSHIPFQLVTETPLSLRATKYRVIKPVEMTQVLNYHDAVVYDSDVALFGKHGWLNDNCINWFFRCKYDGRACTTIVRVYSCSPTDCSYFARGRPIHITKYEVPRTSCLTRTELCIVVCYYDSRKPNLSHNKRRRISSVCCT